MANAIRFLSIDAVEKANSGHPGLPLGMADVATVLYQHFLKFNPRQPTWPDRDRFVLSAGHGSMLLYALNYLTGYEGMTIESLKEFRQLGAHTAGHPEKDQYLGIETTTGPLGQGLGNAVGMAIAEHLLRTQFGEHLFNHFTYVIAGDGCLMEGISHEAISLAGHLKLSKLIVLFDDNRISIDGPTSLSVSDDQLKRFEACGWQVQAIDGHNPEAIYLALQKAHHAKAPSMIACRTTIGYGAPTKAGTSAIHGSSLGAEEVLRMREALNWSSPAFEVPTPILNAWRSFGTRGEQAYTTWEKHLQDSAPEIKHEIERRFRGELPKGWKNHIQELINSFHSQKPTASTRVLSGQVLDTLVPKIPELLGGSADLTGSNNTKAKGSQAISSEKFIGNYIHYGVREHAMAAAMNGISLHGGVVPYGGTFLAFSDYCRPSIRLSALMQIRTIYVMTHDSIGLGEDGPTHQPVEHLAALRAIPNLNVFRPADAIEVAECWALALESQTTPSLLVLTRQNLPFLRTDRTEENLSRKGGYVLSDDPKAQITFLSTGSEVSIAIKAQEELKKKGIATRVVSLPCWRLFELQEKEYQEKVIGLHTLRIAIEAAIPLGWEKYIGPEGAFIGMHSFGASGPYQDLYRHFGITVEAIVELAINKLKEK
ncbi:transketolase [Candidatus Paracaedimonas acanthamoebae]|nr:transketolase [Candidatus Paracaedimonas acanthamoebae]